MSESEKVVAQPGDLCIASRIPLVLTYLSWDGGPLLLTDDENLVLVHLITRKGGTWHELLHV